MGFQTLNDVTTALASDLASSSATSAVVTTGDGALFAGASTTSPIRAGFFDATSGALKEIVDVTGRATDTLTIVREVEDATRFPKGTWTTATVLAAVDTVAVLADLGSWNPVTKTTTYTATDRDLVLADASGGAFTVTLPAVTSKRRVTVRKTDTSVNPVTVSPASGTIDGLSTRLLFAQYHTETYVADGTNWQVEQRHPTSLGNPTPSGGSALTALPGLAIASKGAGSFATTANVIYYVPFWLYAPATLDALSTNIVTGVGAATTKIAVYRADPTLQPGARLYVSSDLDMSTNGTKHSTGIGLGLAPGRYLIGMVDSAALTHRTLVAPHPFNVTRGSINFDSPITFWQKTAASYAAALPDPGTAWDTATVNNNFFGFCVMAIPTFTVL